MKAYNVQKKYFFIVKLTSMIEGEWLCSPSAQCMDSMIESRGNKDFLEFCFKFWIAFQLFAEFAFPFNMYFVAMLVLEIVDTLYC